MPKSIYSPDKLRRFTPLFNKYSKLAEKTYDNSFEKVETVRQLVSPKQQTLTFDIENLHSYKPFQIPAFKF